MKVAVGVCTFGRPDGLARLLDHLELIERPAGVDAVDVLVVDDDPAGTAGSVCADRRVAGRVITYVAHGSRNIASARNAVLDRSDGYDAVVFIDDDERPEPGWLAALVACQRRFDCDVVIGPVIGALPERAPRWMAPHFAIEIGSDGDVLDEGITGNALIKSSTLTQHGFRFAESLGRSGGEDQLFFRQFAAAGLDIRYAAEALVHEDVPAERARIAYLLRRSFRTGNTLGLLDSHVLRAGRSRLVRSAKSVAWIGRGTVSTALGLPASFTGAGRRLVADGLIGVSRGLGMLAGLLGLRLEFYDHTPTLRRWNTS